MGNASDGGNCDHADWADAHLLEPVPARRLPARWSRSVHLIAEDRNELRIVELELRYMQQQELLQELSEVLYEQQRELSALRAEVEAL
ncbi:hypothetical protein DAT35_57845, partial [Vitiosangium sp. GDMCC 1.1324]